MASKRRTTGVYPIHSRSCASRSAGACSCRPTWQAWIPSPRRGGKPIRRNFKSQAEAKAWRADALTASAAGRLAQPTRLTVREASEELLGGMRDGSIPTRSGSRYKPSTIRSYQIALERYILPTLAAYRLTELTRFEVQALADRLTGEGRSASSVQNIVDPLRVIFRRARRRGIVTIDPTEDLELRRPRGRRERIASPAEATSLLVALPDSERALWATAFYAGLRLGELRALRWSDVDLEAKTIRVERSWDEEAGEIDCKSEAGDRTVPVLKLLATVLAAHKLATGRRDDELCFGRTAGAVFVKSTVNNRAKQAWKDANAALITLHEARHTCASVFIAAGANPKAIQSIMGHATIQMTFDQYGHLMPGGLDAAAAKADAYLADAVI